MPSETDWPTQRVLEQSAAWTSPWHPPGSLHRDLGWLEYYVAGTRATVMRVAPVGRDVDGLVRSVLVELRSERVPEVYWTVGPASRPAGLAEALVAAGASVDASVDICAYRLADGLPHAPADPAVSVRPVATRDDVAAFQRVNAAAWGYPPPSEDDVDRPAAGLLRGYVLGCWQGADVGVAGYTLVGEVARFWGAAVVPSARGHGVYRAMVRARLEDAADCGATLALVHAQPTSSPLLQGLGFVVHGQQRVLVVRP